VSPADLEAWGKAIAAIATAVYVLLGPIGRRLKAWRQRRAEERRTLRYLADAVHVLLRERVRRRMPDGDLWYPTDDDLAQQAVRTYEQRNALFRADGHEPPKRQSEARAMTPDEVLVLIRRTQAIQEMKERAGEPAPLFKDGWTPGGGDDRR